MQRNVIQVSRFLKGVCVDPTVGLDVMEKRKSPPLAGNRTPNWVQSTQWLTYPDSFSQSVH